MRSLLSRPFPFRLSPALRGYLHVAGLALVLAGGATLALTGVDAGADAGAAVAVAGLVLLALQPRHPEEG